MNRTFPRTFIAISILWSQSTHADVVMDGSSLHLLDSEQAFPECADSETNAETGEADCPSKIDIRGFDVYLSSYLPPKSLPLVLEWTRLLDAVLLEMETNRDIRGHFIGGLKHAGVSFYLAAPDTNEAVDPYSACRSGCYRSAGRIVEDNLPLTNPSNVNWRSMRHFVIHELAHAYHRIYLSRGYSNQCIKDAYAKSVTRDGLHEGTYAARNYLEYFAQMVSYAMRAASGSYCGEDEERPCREGLIRGAAYRHSPSYPVENKWLLAKYDRNGAALFDAFFDPEGHLDHYRPSRERDPLLNPPIEERSRDCDANIWWPE